MASTDTKISFLHTVLPFNVRNGGEVAIQACVDGLRELGFKTMSIGYQEVGADSSRNPSERTVKNIPIEIESNKLYLFRSILIALFLRIPLSCSKFYSKAYVKSAQEAVDGPEQKTVMIFDRTQMLWVLPYLNRRSNGTKAILIAQNVESELYRERRQGKHSFFANWILARETKLLLGIEAESKKCLDAIWCLTETDAEYFRSLPGDARVDVVEVPSLFSLPSGIDAKKIHSVADIGLLGTWSWAPNMESLLWFLDKVVPLVNRQTRVVVAGSGCQHLKDRYPAIEFAGRVSSATEFLSGCKVVAIPATSGNGVQVKTLDAIACSINIVCTPHALRGISDPPASVKIAESPIEFAEVLNRELSLQTNAESNWTSAQAWTIKRRLAFKEKLGELLHSMTETFR
jgi:polysaccharide biosynthesis protein PslH